MTQCLARGCIATLDQDAVQRVAEYKAEVEAKTRMQSSHKRYTNTAADWDYLVDREAGQQVPPIHQVRCFEIQKGQRWQTDVS